ncbi:nucleic-acid-binding protein from mobile element jockey [Plakobranchus ocellatus]|uniref:Nucleic-acid-binding protein from mobile element jockey n=1 Tax=Plakobranchus ocellatus TaxID=259542 RepID=A0AAV4DZP0_9GAST|nr:nucleic-acid-binding protein from mobile element jockey [Plakobranchus ocellatus]
MVEELSGVTHARRIKMHLGEDKIQTDNVVLTFDSPKPSSRIRAGYLTLDVRPYVPLPMRCYKCQPYGHGKDRCKKPFSTAYSSRKYYLYNTQANLAINTKTICSKED